MKYTIELTDNQKGQMDLLIEMAHKHVGFNPKLEPIKTTNVEDTNEYKIGYKVGYESGYKVGYESGIKLAIGEMAKLEQIAQIVKL